MSHPLSVIVRGVGEIQRRWPALASPGRIRTRSIDRLASRQIVDDNPRPSSIDDIIVMHMRVRTIITQRLSFP